jgi:hypothetical protein
VSDLRTLTETLARPGLLGLRGRAIEKRCHRDLAGYFGHLGRAITSLNLPQCVEFGTKEVALHAVRLKLDNVLRLLRPLLHSILVVNLIEAKLAGRKVHTFAEADPDVNPFSGLSFEDLVQDVLTDQNIETMIDFLGETGREAAEWAEEHAADLVTGIDDTTAELINRAVAVGIADQLGVDGTARLLEAVISGMTHQRALTIARTEMNVAMSQAMLEKLGEEEVEYKRWVISPNACPICQANADEGPIPTEDEFASGDKRPPAHPNCRCALVGSRPPKKKYVA